MNKRSVIAYASTALAAVTFSLSAVAADHRIVGGTDAAPNAYPWMAALVEAGTNNTANAQFCGGSLIAPDAVLTAAHCVEDASAGQIDVVIGANRLGNNAGGERISVSRVIAHPDYARNGTPDIAVLRLSRNSTRTPVDLVQPGSNAASAGTTARVIGWGALSEGGSTPTTLQEVSLPIVSHAACQRAYGSIDQDLEICAGLTQGGRDSCQGDSGGPLFVMSQGNRYAQAGVVSWGEGCAQPGYFGVYARVSSLVSWIEGQLDGNSGGGNGDDNGNDGDNGDTNGGGDSTPPDNGTLTASFQTSCEQTSCQFNATGSSAGSNEIVDYIWDLGDGNWEYGRRVNHTYRRSGNYTVTLYVIDEAGDYAEDSQRVSATTQGGGNGNTGSGNGLVDDIWQGEVERRSSVMVPGDEGMWVPEGRLKVVLRHRKTVNFDLELQMLDETSGEWETIDLSATGGKKEKIRIQTAPAGFYRFNVIARKGAGEFRLKARHK